MDHNPFIQLESLVQDAEVHRHVHHTSEVQKYVDTHPELHHHTRTLTNEIKEKLIFYIANGERDKEEHIRSELEGIRSHIDASNEQGNVLFSLLAEEIALSYLMMRQSDVSQARHHPHLSAQALRRADTAHVRLMRSIRTLASIQKLTPFINVNIGGHQQIALTS